MMSANPKMHFNTITADTQKKGGWIENWLRVLGSTTLWNDVKIPSGGYERSEKFKPVIMVQRMQECIFE